MVDQGNLAGVVTINQLKEVPREEWNTRTVKDIAETCTEGNTIDPDADATKALEKMSRTGTGRLMVVDHGRLVGILVLRDLLRFLSNKLDLEAAEV